MFKRGKTELFEELLNLLAEEQCLPKGTPTARDDVERGKYRCERIQELASQIRSTDEAKS
jgi:hypothetical protein